ncbi:hypothetical protein D0850_16265 [Bordetella avium]|uniref:hypothetical protein n=1 Tax=Bordetella avium TaxID=521 RepID=UPI000E6857F7|nr:hypothetical protein [Bordetella avium]RIQ16065.1 hypothetical protein D0850_16265 [Bordetella avium]
MTTLFDTSEPWAFRQFAPCVDTIKQEFSPALTPQFSAYIGKAQISIVISRWEVTSPALVFGLLTAVSAVTFVTLATVDLSTGCAKTLLGHPMSNVRKMNNWVARKMVMSGEGPIAPPPSEGDNGGMDRLDHLEKRVDEIDSRLGRIEGDVATLKSDVGSIKDGLSDLKIGIAELNAKFNIGEIRANVEKSHTDIYKWIATLALSAIGAAVAIFVGIQRLAPTIPPQGYPPAVAPMAPQDAPTSTPAPPSALPPK